MKIVSGVGCYHDEFSFLFYLLIMHYVRISGIIYFRLFAFLLYVLFFYKEAFFKLIK